VPVSERALNRLAARIDAQAAERDGFVLSGWGPDIDRSVVMPELITKRTDHLAYFRERYGPRTDTKVIATEPHPPACRNRTTTAP